MIISPESLNQSRGSFRATSVLYLLQRAVSQQEWRVPVLHHRLLEHLEPQLSHPYKLVRDRLGSVLSIIFLFDIELLGGRLSSQPAVTDFIEHLLTGLQPLWISKSDAKDGISETDGPASLIDMNSLAVTLPAVAGSPEDRQKQENAIVQLLKTALNWLVADGSLQPLQPSLFRLLPLILRHNDQEEDEELDALSKAALQQLAISWLPSVSIEPLLQGLETVVNGNSWRAIRSALSFLSVKTDCFQTV
jgi:proteasome activator subunit 4